jgi:Phospholipase_D-nuclease N-terminal
MEFLEGLNWGLLAPIFIIQLILLIVCLVDLSHNEKTNGPKWLWVLIIIFINIIGPILYFVIGRRSN